MLFLNTYVFIILFFFFSCNMVKGCVGSSETGYIVVYDLIFCLRYLITPDLSVIQIVAPYWFGESLPLVNTGLGGII